MITFQFYHYISPPGKRGFIDLQSRTLFIAKYSLDLLFSDGPDRTKRQRYLDLKSEIPPPWDPRHCSRPNGPSPPPLGQTRPGAYVQPPFPYAPSPAGPCVASGRRALSHSYGYGVLAAPPSHPRPSPRDASHAPTTHKPAGVPYPPHCSQRCPPNRGRHWPSEHVKW